MGLLALREYQERAFEKIRDHYRQGYRTGLLVAPTGSGKTVTSSHLIAGANKRGYENMFLTHRREILYQTSRKLSAANIDHNFILAGHRKGISALTHLASIQTLLRREFPNVRFIIIDEAHHAVANSYKKVLAAYPDAKVLGLTATPCRGDGRGLGGIFEFMVVAATVAELIQLDFLVRPKIFNAEIPSAEGLHTRGGDYIDSELSERYDTPKLVGDIVENWFVHAHGMRTLVFATDIAHSLHITRYFNEAGVKAEHLDGETPHKERKAILERHSTGRTTVLCNVGVATEGYDDPNIQAVVLARRTKSFGLYLQMAGRVLRPATDPEVRKEFALLLDHADCWGDHGSPDEPVVWTLDPEGDAVSYTKAAEKRLAKEWRCSVCGHVNLGGKHCDACGYARAPEAKSPVVAMGRLTEVRAGARKRKENLDDKERYWNQCLWQCIHGKRKVGAAAHMYKKRYGVWPSHKFKEMPHGKEEWSMRADKFHRVYLQRSERGF